MPKTKAKPDTRMKEFWRNNERFADLFNAFFFNGEKVIDPEDLQEADTDVSGTLNKNTLGHDYQKALDVVKKTAYGMDLVILGLENQQKIHYAMPLRIMQGDVLLYMKEYNEIQKRYRKAAEDSVDEFLGKFRKTDRLHPVITICIYYGEKDWDGPRCLADMLALPEKMKGFVADYKINLLEIKKSSNIAFKNHDVADVFEITRNIYENGVASIDEKYTAVNPDVGIMVGCITNTQNLIEKATIAKKKGGYFNMCTAMKEFAIESAQKADERYSKLINILFADGKVEEVKKIAEDKEYREELYKRYNL